MKEKKNAIILTEKTALCDAPRYDDAIRQLNFLFENFTIEEFIVFDITTTS